MNMRNNYNCNKSNMYVVNTLIIVYQRFTHKAKTCCHKNLRFRRSFSKVFEGKRACCHPDINAF